MTAVQWWTSGVVLGTIFGAPTAGPRSRGGDAAAKNAAPAQGHPGPSAPAAASGPSGATFDRTA